MPSPHALFWFRRDLRLEDNTALSAALTEMGGVLPVFIFDRNILDKVEDRDDPRIAFLYDELAAIKEKLESWGGTLRVYYGRPEEVYRAIKTEFPELKAVYANRDYEVYAKERDAAVAKRLNAQGVSFVSFKDQVVFEGRDVVTQAGKTFGVYTPYAKAWRAQFQAEMLHERPVEKHREAFWQTERRWPMPTLEEMGFTRKPFAYMPSKEISAERLRAYAETRNLPALDSTSHLSLHLRFGTVSIRRAFEAGLAYSDKWASELVWREFYMQLLDNSPRIEKESYKPAFDNIAWRNDEAEFEAWCEGRTGYPLVDAGMRQLNQERWMHNRVRMVTASFLSKHLLIDWRWGDAYFARKLLDYDLAANNGGWQWAAGTGADSAPYFRVFNPALQAQKFDPHGDYVRKYVPEATDPEYLQNPIVEHGFARARALEAYRKAVKGE